MLTLKDMNPRVLAAEYAVRGPIVQRAQELERRPERSSTATSAIRSPEQKPLRYLRQGLSLLENPELLDSPSTVSSYPKDIVSRVRQILKAYPDGTGAYTQSSGIPFIRQAVAEFITRRDGIPADKDRILLTDERARARRAVIIALVASPSDGVMIPIPQYPLYSATLALYGGAQIGYYLDEDNRWQLNQAILTASIDEAIAKALSLKPLW